jgi:hypothetical protein
MSHAPDRWLVLQLMLQVARPHTASLPLAQSLRKPGCLGDAVGRCPALTSLLGFAITPPALHNTLPVGLAPSSTYS